MRSKPAPVSTPVRERGRRVPSGSWKYWLKTRFQISTMRPQPCSGPHSASVAPRGQRPRRSTWISVQGPQGPLAPVGPQKFSRPPSGFSLRGRMRSEGTPVARHSATDSSSGGSPALPRRPR